MCCKNLSLKPSITSSSMMLVEKPLPAPDGIKLSTYVLTGITPRSLVSMFVRIIDATLEK